MTARSGLTLARMGGSRVRAVRVLPDVACMRCIWCFSFDYHQKCPRIHFICKVTLVYGVRKNFFPYVSTVIAIKPTL
jgi:hypothetical protein